MINLLIFMDDYIASDFEVVVFFRRMASLPRTMEKKLFIVWTNFGGPMYPHANPDNRFARLNNDALRVSTHPKIVFDVDQSPTVAMPCKADQMPTVQN